MKFCPNCGSPIEDGQKFCAECGERLDVPAPAEMPPEPVYTDDPALTQNPILNSSPSFAAPTPKEEKVPELTLEPDLWGLGAAAAAAAAPAPKPEPAPAAEPASPAQAAAPAAEAAQAQAAEAAQAPDFAPVMEDVHYDNPLRDEKEQTHELPNDYSMAPKPKEEAADGVINENLMLAWSIVLTGLCSICGIVGLVKSIKARKAPWEEKVRLLKSAKIWLIVGTALHVLGYLGSMF